MLSVGDELNGDDSQRLETAAMFTFFRRWLVKPGHALKELHRHRVVFYHATQTSCDKILTAV